MERIYAEPFRSKIVEHLRMPTLEERKAALRAAGYNLFQLDGEKVFLDFLTPTGTSAMSEHQWAGMMVGDEAYAGSRNFFHIQEKVQDIFGKKFVVPTHAGRGAWNLITHVFERQGAKVLHNGNLPFLPYHARRHGMHPQSVGRAEARDPGQTLDFRGDVDLDRLEEALKEPVAFVNLAALPTGQLGGPISLSNYRQAVERIRAHGAPLILDASRIALNAFLIREKERPDASLKEIIREMAEPAQVILFNAREDAFTHTGALIITDDEDLYVAFRSLVVVFEGLHTYGGLAGRDMEALARGLGEMLDEDYLRYRIRLIEDFHQKLEAQGAPVVAPPTPLGALLDARTLLSHLSDDLHPAEAAAAALYLIAGLRAASLGKLFFDEPPAPEILALWIPRRRYDRTHLEYALEAVEALREKAPLVAGLRLINDPTFVPHLTARFEPQEPDLLALEKPRVFLTRPTPFARKSVELVILRSREYRQQAIEEAGYNTFLLRSEDVYIDLLTDSGTSAMSERQWAALMEAREIPSGTKAYHALVEAVQEVLGFPYVVPTHQGRAAEHILSQTMIRPGQYVINNMYFTTTREHQERAGGIFVDLIVDEAHDPTSTYPFKGDIDPGKLRRFIEKHGAEQIAYVCLETNVNMAGGQPVSIRNTREIAEICHSHGIPLVFDATRCAENAYFIKQREPGYQETPIPEILRELLSYGDALTFSAKKDPLVNIGGFIAVRDPLLYERMRRMATLFEGEYGNGGLAQRDLYAMAVGLHEMTDEAYLEARISQTHYLAQLLLDEGIPIVLPPGGHAVYLDAKRFLPHLPQDQFPAQRLAAEIYVEGGVRTMERGIVSAGRDKKTGKHKYPKLELVRITIPRRVYSNAHMEVTAEAIRRVWERRESIGGLEMVFEPPTLRFFTARFRPLDQS